MPAPTWSPLLRPSFTDASGLPNPQSYMPSTIEREPGVFGGRNSRGFLGSGYFEADPLNFLMPQVGRMNQRLDTAAGQAQQGMDPQLVAQEQARQQQMALAQSLQGTLAGTTPSVANEQLKQATDTNIANAYAMAQAGRNNPAAARMVANQAGALSQQGAGQGAMLRAQEIANAQGQLGGVLGGMRGQDLGAYQTLQQGMLGALGQQAGLNTAQLQAQIQHEQLNQQAFANQPTGLAAIAQPLAGIAGAITPFIPHAQGGLIPGMPAVGGRVDTPANDSVPVMASPGEVVLPRSVTMADDAPERARAFVEAIRRQKLKRAA